MQFSQRRKRARDNERRGSMPFFFCIEKDCLAECETIQYQDPGRFCYSRCNCCLWCIYNTRYWYNNVSFILLTLQGAADDLICFCLFSRPCGVSLLVSIIIKNWFYHSGHNSNKSTIHEFASEGQFHIQNWFIPTMSRLWSPVDEYQSYILSPFFLTFSFSNIAEIILSHIQFNSQKKQHLSQPFFSIWSLTQEKQKKESKLEGIKM